MAPERAVVIVMMNISEEIYLSKPALISHSYDFSGTCITYTKFKVFHNKSRNTYAEL